MQEKTIATWLNLAKKRVASLDAELILLQVFKLQKGVVLDRTYLFAHSERKLSPELIELADKLLERRIQGEPLAYIVGEKEFYGRKFKVDERVLIPRPETEGVIGLVKKIAEELETQNPEIYDIGTGSGCIAISLALEIPGAKVTAVDVSEKALEVAQENAKNLGAEVRFEKRNLLRRLTVPENAIIVANLPYVDEKWQWLDKKALSFEPELALYARKNGLRLIFKLIKQVKKLKKPVRLVLEADPSQHQEIIEFAEQNGLQLMSKEAFLLNFAIL